MEELKLFLKAFGDVSGETLRVRKISENTRIPSIKKIGIEIVMVSKSPEGKEKLCQISKIEDNVNVMRDSAKKEKMQELMRQSMVNVLKYYRHEIVQV